MFENIRNVITRLPMDRLRPNLGGHIPSFLRHVPPRFGCHNGALKILQLWASGDRTRVPILIKFGTRQHVMTRTTITWLNIKILKIQNGGRPLCWKYIRNAINRLPTGTQLGWSHHLKPPTCPPSCGFHGNGRCLPTAHWTFCSYGRLEAERVNQFRWYSEHNSTLGPQWQSHDQILKFLTFKKADGRHVGKYCKYRNSPSNWPIGTKLGWSHSITFPTCPPK